MLKFYDYDRINVNTKLSALSKTKNFKKRLYLHFFLLLNQRLPNIDTPNLKLHADPSHMFNTVTAYGNGYLEINRQKYYHSVIFMPEGNIIPWPVENDDQLNESHFAMVALHQPELVIFGSGQKHQFPHPLLLKPLMQQHIGIETMNTQAACRTYNILMAEGRKVLAALLVNTTL